MKVLLIYHQPNLLLSLYRTLRRDYEIECATSPDQATKKLHQQPVNLIIIDLDGAAQTIDYGVLRSIAPQTPLIFLATNAPLERKIAALDSGAHDFLEKPLPAEELLARLRTVLRQTDSNINSHKRLVIGDLVLDTAKHVAIRNGIPIMLRLKEFALLECLMRNAGTIVSSAVLATQAWEHEQDALVSNLHVHINHLRKKIDHPFETALIRTVHGLGYMLEIPIPPHQEPEATLVTSSRQISIL